MFQADLGFSKKMDQEDRLSQFRSEFLFPTPLYFAGNSLGLQPKKTREYVSQELDDWARLGVEGHLHAKNPWLPYHEYLTEKTARLVGAKPEEVVVMNSLTVNLHLLMASFYRPTPKRSKILIEKGAFPSDRYAVTSQIRWHGYDPEKTLIEVGPRSGEDLIRVEDLLAHIQDEGESIALILLGNVNYLTGQAFPIRKITEAGHARGCFVGFDLAHGAGNLALELHADGPDFASWCSYKYLNAGPGAIAGAFVHSRHLGRDDLPRLEGWWGTNKQTRFKMKPGFESIPTAEAWQLSNPPIFQLAALRASMELFDQATMKALRAKSETLTAYFEFLLKMELSEKMTIVTPSVPADRGAHLSIRWKKSPHELMEKISKEGVICDFREPDILRFAPAPLYNSFHDVYELVQILKRMP